MGGDVEGALVTRVVKLGGGALAFAGVYGVVLGTGDGAGDARMYVGYGPEPLKSRRTFCSNSVSAEGSMLSCHSRYEHISRSIWLISRSANMPWPTIDHDLFEYVSSQMTLLAIMNALMKRRWPEEPRAAGKRAFRRCSRYSAANVTDVCRRVRCSAYAMKLPSAGDGAGGMDVDSGGRSGHVNRCVTNREHSFAVSSCP